MDAVRCVESQFGIVEAATLRCQNGHRCLEKFNPLVFFKKRTIYHFGIRSCRKIDHLTHIPNGSYGKRCPAGADGARFAAHRFGFLFDVPTFRERRRAESFADRLLANEGCATLSWDAIRNNIIRNKPFSKVKM